MALPLKQHAIDSFEMGKKMIPVYLGLLMKFLAYVLGMVTVLLGAVFLDVSSVVRVVFLFTYIALLIAVVIQGMRYNVAKIKALAAVDAGKTEVDKIWADSKGNFWKLLFLGITVSLIIGIGMFFLIIPGVIFLVWFGFSYFAAFIRDQEIFESLKYSKKVAKGHFWMVLVRAILVGVLFVVFMIPAGVLESSMKAQFQERLLEVTHEDARPIENYGEIEPEELLTERFGEDTEDILEAFENSETDLQLAVLKSVFGDVKWTFLLYVIYVAVGSFLFMCFLYPYWYLLFKELEKVNKVKG